MNWENWQKINAIYLASLDCSSTAACKQLLREQCGDDAGLRLEIENLLAAIKNAAENDFLAENVVAAGARILAETDADEATNLDQIGNYRVIEKLGQGGMGTVFLAARQGDFAQKVALKIIKRGMDSAAVIRRFESERQILASLNHPNIARLLDGGTTVDGSPFFVMEYVEGLPINDYCQTKNVILEKRLELFRAVCSAVEYAHKNLIVHRDLKPSNILVTADGVPKLLDFGIAKLLSAEADGARESETQTATFLRMFTPDYASPEQVRGATRLSTATDIYSLGVCLYELLTDQRPLSFAGKSYEEVLRTINEIDPERPSRIVTRDTLPKPTNGELRINPQSKVLNPKSLVGDLDNIILKALRKEPEQRYSSIEEFAGDIRRYLLNLPVLARPQTFSYKIEKYFKRNRVAVLAAALVLLSLIGGLSVAIWQAIEARSERMRAEMRFNQVRKLANTVIFDYHERIKNLPGATETRKKLVTDALEYLDNLSQTSDNSPDLQRELALAYRKVAQIQNGSEDSGNTGETSASLTNYRKALEIQEKLVANQSANDGDRRILAKLYFDVEERLPEANAILVELAKKNPNNAEAQSDLANGSWKQAESLRAGGNYDEAVENYRQAGNIYEKLAATETEKRGAYLRNAALIYKNIGGVFEQKGEFSKTLEMYRRALAIDAENAAADPNNTQYQLDLSFSYNSIASSLMNSNNPAEALINCQQALKIQENVAAADAQNAFAQHSLARTYRRMGDIQGTLGNTEAAIASYQKSIKLFETITWADPGNSLKQLNLADLYYSFAGFRVTGANNLKKNFEKISWLREAQMLQKRGLEIIERLKSQNKIDKQGEDFLRDLQEQQRKTAENLAQLTAK